MVLEKDQVLVMVLDLVLVMDLVMDLDMKIVMAMDKYKVKIMNEIFDNKEIDESMKKVVTLLVNEIYELLKKDLNGIEITEYLTTIILNTISNLNFEGKEKYELLETPLIFDLIAKISIDTRNKTSGSLLKEFS